MEPHSNFDLMLEHIGQKWPGVQLSVEEIARFSGVSNDFVQDILDRAVWNFKREWIDRYGYPEFTNTSQEDYGFYQWTEKNIPDDNGRGVQDFEDLFQGVSAWHQ